MSEIKKAIAYFEDGIRETDEIIAGCSPDLQAELTSPVKYYTDGKPYLQIGGFEMTDNPIVEACARLDRDEKYIIPHLQAQLAEYRRRERAAVEFIHELRCDDSGDWGDMAIKALERQIPKEPAHKDGDYFCQVCGTYCGNVHEGMQKYCDECGQALKWD